MDEILMLQDEIGELQTCFAEELADSDSDGEPGDQLALQSTLTVLGERMATIRMKASGKRQLLDVSASAEHQIYLVLLYTHERQHLTLTSAGETERAARGAAAGAGAAALPHRGRGAGPLAAQHSGHSELGTAAPKQRPGHGGAAHRLSGEADAF